MSKLSKMSINHAAGIYADMSVDGPAIGTLVIIVDRAKNLPNRKTMSKQNPYCAARLGKEAKKTQTDMRGGQTPRWDHELRFTVHESPDYFKLKVSVFNDDKKTDLIGETWIDLQNLIIPGGSQNDHWHPLQSRGKYAGDIRLEMTYYDTREQDEALIGRRKEAAERVQGKTHVSSNSTPSIVSSLSGPRQLNAVKRRPLPTDPSGATPPQPSPLHHPMPSRMSMHSHANSVPAVPMSVAGQDFDSRPIQPRSQSEYPQQRDYHQASQYQTEVHQPPQPHDIYSPLSPQYNTNPMTFGHVSAFSPRSSKPEESISLEYSSGHGDDDMYEPHHVRPLQTSRRDNYHPEYASMQARVEDEEEDGPPPPPPVHRSWTQPIQTAQLPVANPPSPYQPYSPGYHSNKPAVPASLVAGYENDEDMNDRSVLESRRPRSASSHYEDEMMIPPSPRMAPSYPQESPVPLPYEPAMYPVRSSPQPMDDRPRGGSVGFDNRMVTRKSVSPRPSISSEHGSSATPFSPDSYNSLNPNASRSATNRDPTPMYDSPGQARDAALRAEIEPVRNLDQPIIGDDGREIDPSDHLPTDTWAPEPERKNRKPEVIIRFKHSARPTSRGSDRPTSRGTETSARSSPRVGFRTETVSYGSDRVRYSSSHAGDAVERTPRGQDIYTRYSTPTSDRPRSSRGSVSPSPSARSPLYEYSSGPPVPSKVPINPGPSYPVASSGGSGMDALSRELKTIDLGSVGCSPSRAVRKYAAPRASATMGYAS